MTSSNSHIAKRAALFLVSAILIAGCGQQNNSQTKHEKFAGGGHQRLRAVCADDIQKYCATADKKRRCLRDNVDKLSDSCKAALAEHHGHGGRKRDNDDGTDD